MKLQQHSRLIEIWVTLYIEHADASIRAEGFGDPRRQHDCRKWQTRAMELRASVVGLGC